MHFLEFQDRIKDNGQEFIPKFTRNVLSMINMFYKVTHLKNFTLNSRETVLRGGGGGAS